MDEKPPVCPRFSLQTSWTISAGLSYNLLMSRETIVYEVLIASPSDVKDERGVLKEVVEDWNSAHSRAHAISLQPRLWELDSMPAAGDRPQEILNKQLVEKANILLAVFWTRLGTPTGQAPSGTVEEIEHFRHHGKPVLLYFSEADIPHGHDPEQFHCLKNYRKSLQNDTLYKTFRGSEDLRRQATRDLARIVNELHSSQAMREPPGKEENEFDSRNIRTLFELDWIIPHRQGATKQLGSLQKKSFIEGVYLPCEAGIQWNLNQLLTASSYVPLAEYGFLEQGNTTDKRLFEGIVRENLGEDREWYIYWTCQKNGNLYTLASLPEEMRSSDGALSAQKRLLQIANILVCSFMFYKKLGLSVESRFHVGVQHGGLLGRTLKKSRYGGTPSYGPCAEDRVPSIAMDTSLDDMGQRRWQLLKKLAEPFFDIFGFPLPPDSDYQLYADFPLNGPTVLWSPG